MLTRIQLLVLTWSKKTKEWKMEEKQGEENPELDLEFIFLVERGEVPLGPGANAPTPIVPAFDLNHNGK